MFLFYCCFRSFWIQGKWNKNIDNYKVRVGLGSDPRGDELLKTVGINESEMNMTIIRLSTSSENSGEWQFASGINRFMPNVFSHPYQLDESISNFRVIGLYFSFH